MAERGHHKSIVVAADGAEHVTGLAAFDLGAFHQREVTGFGGLFSTLFSGEGLVMRFSGRGRVLVQTRSTGGLVGWIRGILRG